MDDVLLSVISNGVINLCADERAVFDEVHRVLRPGGGCSTPTSSTVDPCPRRRYATSTGEEKARAFEVFGYAFLARKPTNPEGGP